MSRVSDQPDSMAPSAETTIPPEAVVKIPKKSRASDQPDSMAPSAETTIPPEAVVKIPKKKRGNADGKAKSRRKPSDYLVLVEIPKQDAGVMKSYNQLAEGPTKKACEKTIKEKRLTGELEIVCVRRRTTATIDTTVKLT